MNLLLPIVLTDVIKVHILLKRTLEKPFTLANNSCKRSDFSLEGPVRAGTQVGKGTLFFSGPWYMDTLMYRKAGGDKGRGMRAT